MNPADRAFVALCAQVLSLPGPVYEFGSRQVPGQEGFADLRPFFRSQRYVGADIQSGPGVDAILDVHHLSLPDASVGTALALNILEHIPDPSRAIAEIHRVLKPDGIALFATPFKCILHDFPHDYWRFTPEAYRLLLSPFADHFVEWAGESEFPYTVVAVGFKNSAEPERLNELQRRSALWRTQWSNPLRTDTKSRLLLFVPPIVHSLYRRLVRGAF